MDIRIKISPTDDADVTLALPSYETAGAAGADLRANFPVGLRETGLALAAGSRALIPLGFCMEIPPGFEAQIRPRSGLALKHGVTLMNAPGTIDADYRGPVGVILFNASSADYHVRHGDRIAQMVIAPVIQANFVRDDALSRTSRGQGGFGSTGTGRG